MVAAIHIEINILFLLVLAIIFWQITRSVSQQMSRVLFRFVVFGSIITLTLDTIWMLIDGRIFPGCILANKLVNAAFLGITALMGGVWYLYILDFLGYELTKRRILMVLTPGIILAILNVLSLKTGWIFTIDENNVYVRGPWFLLQTIGALSTLTASLIHLIIFYFLPNTKVPRHQIRLQISFYSVPFIGTVLALPISGMPGTWTCSAVSIILMYMNDQDNAVQRDSLTGLNNRKNLEQVFKAYTKQISEKHQLYLFMLDLDNLKQINDTYGHPTGDHVLVETSGLIMRSLEGRQGYLARYGGDEFLIMCFFAGEEDAIQYKKALQEEFSQWNDDHDDPYSLSCSIGHSRYQGSETLEELVQSADEILYADKRRHRPDPSAKKSH